MRVGIISFAHGHAYSYAEAFKKMDEVELVGIADDNEERGVDAAMKYNTNYYPNYEDLLDQDIEAVIITSENYKHHEHVLAAAKKGKHILCEKPIATNKKDAVEMIEVCKENNVFLQIAFPVRFSTPVAKAKQIIEDGELGSIIAIKGTNRGTNPGGWFVEKEKSGGGAVMDHTVHLVDIMRWYMGSDVKEVYAELDNLISDIAIDDCGIVTMEFENNVFASIDCSWSRNKTFPTWGDVTLEIIGTKGTLSVDAFAQKTDVYSVEGAQWDFWGEDMNQDLVEDFVSNVKNGVPPTITGEDGLKAMEVALAGYESAKRKGPVLIEKELIL
ncbi:Gfo/Idh/MocA family oxidoreductase [Niallia sp.]|uniref:Gfo/Idh/MocA family protein n=1 Tax=Niallia sp. TaxID=2837523 RepID=UPI00289B389C|nr:Gfo/Idh/MocA family oxidoreductase [Niallia sp.]